ncbi:MAG TPA: leucyl aminopeptidase [Sporichthyaceae bacterium]|nr:leucyl aminopeptidase [Sporichthyaceae bacterium]
MATISLSGAAVTEVKGDAVVVGVSTGPRGLVLTDAAKAVEAALGGKLAALLTALGHEGKAEQIAKLPGGGKVAATLVVVVGLGKAPGARAGWDNEVLRRAAGAATRSMAGSRSVALALPASDAGAVGAVAEGALLGAYAFLRYRSTDNGSADRAPVAAITVCADSASEPASKAAVSRAEVVAEAVSLVRDLVNTPPSDLRPADLATEATTAGAVTGVKVEVMDDKALKKGGYGGIVGVGQGSSSPPRLVKLTYRHPRAKVHLALVGKGVTFDSGGLSLKPADAMITMKCDMGGAAAVVAATRAIARLKLPVNVTTWAPMVENMPSGTAQRPSDVLKMYSGKTVEVLNTDAEGRLILADALARACEDTPDVLVDIATLTGAVVIALGHRTSAIMANDDDLRARVHDVADRAGEPMWPLPLPEELRAGLKSSVADIANIGERFGGALTAGIFLKEFVADGVKWAHLDIAGTAFNESEPYGYTPKGGTGAGVRTLIRLAEDLAENGAPART